MSLRLRDNTLMQRVMHSRRQGQNPLDHGTQAPISPRRSIRSLPPIRRRPQHQKAFIENQRAEPRRNENKDSPGSAWRRSKTQVSSTENRAMGTQISVFRGRQASSF